MIVEHQYLHMLLLKLNKFKGVGRGSGIQLQVGETVNMRR